MKNEERKFLLSLGMFDTANSSEMSRRCRPWDPDTLYDLNTCRAHLQMAAPASSLVFFWFGLEMSLFHSQRMLLASIDETESILSTMRADSDIAL